MKSVGCRSQFRLRMCRAGVRHSKLRRIGRLTLLGANLDIDVHTGVGIGQIVIVILEVHLDILQRCTRHRQTLNGCAIPKRAGTADVAFSAFKVVQERSGLPRRQCHSNRLRSGRFPAFPILDRRHGTHRVRYTHVAVFADHEAAFDGYRMRRPTSNDSGTISR